MCAHVCVCVCARMSVCEADFDDEKELKCVVSVSQSVGLSDIKAEMSCAFESCTSYVSGCMCYQCLLWMKFKAASR